MKLAEFTYTVGDNVQNLSINPDQVITVREAPTDPKTHSAILLTSGHEFTVDGTVSETMAILHGEVPVAKATAITDTVDGNGQPVGEGADYPETATET
jgi:hypothetical protein